MEFFFFLFAAITALVVLKIAIWAIATKADWREARDLALYAPLYVALGLGATFLVFAILALVLFVTPKGLLQMITGEVIIAFCIGAALGSIITYFNVTRERRIISGIRSDIDFLGAYHNLSPGQWQRIAYGTKGIVSDDEAWAIYGWALEVRKELRKSGRKINPAALAAEAIICEKLLGLSRIDAVQAQLNCKSANELSSFLDARIAEAMERRK